MVTIGDTIQLSIDKPAAGGRMIARHEGQVILVGGAIPGEKVTAVVERVARGVAFATTSSVIEPSPDRRDERQDPLCGGCLYAFIAYPRQLEIKADVVADAFARIAHLDLPSPISVEPSPEAGYRMRARLHCRRGRIGFFREGTHEICDAKQTRQLLSSTTDALDRLGEALGSLGLDAVDEIEVSENIDASERVVQLGPAQTIDPRLLDRLGATDGLTGVACGSMLRGSRYVTDSLPVIGRDPVALRRDVGSFFQGNRYLLGTLVEHVVARVPSDASLVDLYAGSGLFAVSAAAGRAARVVAVEGDRAAADDLAANAAASGLTVQAIHQSVEAFVSTALAGTRADCLIADPPRTGLSRDALAGIGRHGPERMVYVSCDVATLARDARGLAGQGYELVDVRAFDLFPNTPHVETVAVFNRDRAARPSTD